MMTDLIREHQRLVILRLLHEAVGMDLNESILQDGLDAYGLDISRDNLRTELAWLEHGGFVKLTPVGRSQVAALTSRGEDAALGRARVPGIKRPRAGE